ILFKNANIGRKPISENANDCALRKFIKVIFDNWMHNLPCTLVLYQFVIEVICAQKLVKFTNCVNSGEKKTKKSNSGLFFCRTLF
ncbi:hypothetical protein, partial [Vibrio cholerae]|uniref:hypothetical protein n=1 Tax=Vibrio cholerae TaxID=666 RepID=UPI001C279DA2